MKRRFFPPRPPFPQKRKRILLYAEKSKPYPGSEDLSTEMTVWGMFLALLLICVCTTKFRLSSFPFMKNAMANTTPVGSLRCSSHRACSCGICLCFHNAVFSFLHNNRDGEQVARFRFPQGNLRNLCARIRAFPFCE